MAQQTVTISYRSAYTNGIATANTTATVNVPVGCTPDQHIANIFRAHVFSFTDPTGVLTFIATSEIFKITSP